MIFEISFLLLIFSFICLLYCFTHFNQSQSWKTSFISFFILVCCFYYILIVFQCIWLNLSNYFTILFWIILLFLPILIALILIIFSFFISFFFKNKQILFETSNLKKDTIRKLFHLFIFFGILSFYFFGHIFIELLLGISIPLINNESKILFYSFLPTEYLTYYFVFEWGQFLLFFCFYYFTIFSLFNEITRKVNLSFPLHFIKKIYYSDEKDGYGNYLYFGIGMMFSALLCPPLIFFAILGVCLIGDLVSSQVGIRFGKHFLRKIPKTWEGLLSGTIISFFISFLFVGLKWAIIFSLIYFLIDFFTDNRLIVDNLAIPFFSSSIYIIFSYFFGV